LRPFNLLDLIDHLGAHARKAILWALALAAAGYLGSFLIPPIYQATAVILPPDDDELTAALSLSRRAGAGGLGALSRLGSGTYFTQADIALATLRSRSLYATIVKQFELQARYKKKSLDDAIRELKDKSSVRIATDGTIAVSVRDRDPERAAGMANAFFAKLDEFNRTFRASKARRTREFLERRVVDTDSLLRDSERKLAAYQGRKGAVVLLPEARGAAEAAASLMGQKIQAEVDLAILRTYASPQSEELQRAESRVRELSRKIGSLPATQVGGAELARQVVIQQQVFALLTAQLEEARIREVMDTPTVQILDPATAPEKRLWPRRSWIAAFGFALGLLIGFVPLRLLARPRPGA
jgi:uncharacterized protein involved in exopolysaccharide biosynthesis